MTSNGPVVPPPPPPPPPPGPDGNLPPPAGQPVTLGTPAQTKRGLSLGTPVIVVLALVAAVGAYFAVTKVTDRPPPTEAEVTAAFVEVPGFTYSDLPAETLGALESAFTSQAGPEAVAHFEARQLSEGAGPAAVVFVLAIDPDDMRGNFEEQYVSGFTATSQATVEDIQIGSTTGHIAETPLGTVAFFFDEDGFAFNVVGRDNPTVEGIARTLQAGNS